MDVDCRERFSLLGGVGADFTRSASTAASLVATSGSVSVSGQVKLTSAGESNLAEVPSKMTAVTGARLSSDTVLLVGADQYSDLVAVYRRHGLKYLGLTGVYL